MNSTIAYVDQPHIVASELKDPICHSDECQIGSFSSEATIYRPIMYMINLWLNQWLFDVGAGASLAQCLVFAGAGTHPTKIPKNKIIITFIIFIRKS